MGKRTVQGELMPQNERGAYGKKEVSRSDKEVIGMRGPTFAEESLEYPKTKSASKKGERYIYLGDRLKGKELTILQKKNLRRREKR